jgi:two-component system sensor histidine kinase/response regulator
MNGIVATVDLMRETKLTKEQEVFVENIQHSGNLLLSIVNDILNVSKIEFGKLELEKVKFSLVKLIDNTFMLISHRKTKETQLIKDIEPSLPEQIITDPIRLEQILIS